MRNKIKDLAQRSFHQLGHCLVLAAILCTTDLFFIRTNFTERFPRLWTAYPETWGVLLLLSLAFGARGFFWSVAVICVMAFLEMCHLSFYGTFIHPTGIFLFLTQFDEVLDSLSMILPKMALPTLLFVTNIVLIWFLYKKWRYSPIGWKYFKYILVFILCYSPLRSFYTGDNYGKQPAIQNIAFSNMYASLSYFVSKTVPFKLSKKSVVASDQELTLQTKTPQVNIVFVLGESLTFKHMQIFGYDRPNTPRLQALMNDGRLIARKAVSGGVSTDVAIPLLINDYQGIDPGPVIFSQHRCLFKLAKKNGFQTSLFSIQTRDELRHIVTFLCPNEIENLAYGEEFSKTSGDTNLYDELLLHRLQEVDFSTPQFVVLHQRGSHSPYDKRYPKEFAKIPILDSDSFDQKTVKHYDNSVVYTDHVLSRVIETVMGKSKLPTYVIYTSDHGESLGENGQWGHVMLNAEGFKVPFLFATNDANFGKTLQQNWPGVVAHQDISDLIVTLLGYRRDIVFPAQREVYVMGSDLDGLDGGMKVRLEGGEIQGFDLVPAAH